MADDATLSLEPVGTDRFEIVLRRQQGVIRARLRGPDNNGYTEADLRNPQGLPKLGLSEERIEHEIAAANARRAAA